MGHGWFNNFIMEIIKMFNYNITRLEKSCSQLIDTLEKTLTWKWDGRFETVLAEFTQLSGLTQKRTK